jgi:cytochrome c553
MNKLAVLAAMLAMLGGNAWAQTSVVDRIRAIESDPKALRAAIDAGQRVTSFCANCHGEEGTSKLPEVPNLAGQNPAYLLEQVRKFDVGERKDAFMQGLIHALKEEERLQAVIFFASKKPLPGKGDAVEVAKGKALFSKLCVRCHGEQAYGNEKIPRIASQKQTYLQLSIIRYRDRTGERREPLMTAATSQLKDEDVRAIANYLTTLP